MVKPAYLFFAFLTFLIFVAILVAFVALPDNGGPFDRGDTPSRIAGLPGRREAQRSPGLIRGRSPSATIAPLR